MGILKSESDAFEAAATEQFTFLEQDFGLTYAGATTVHGDRRDCHVAVKYRRQDFRVDITWGPGEMSLEVLIRLSNSDLDRRERYVYFEPFLEFTTKGSVLPVVPHVYPRMSIGRIQEVMKLREQLFRHGFGNALGQVAQRLRKNYAILQSSATETVRMYQYWYQTRARSSDKL